MQKFSSKTNNHPSKKGPQARKIQGKNPGHKKGGGRTHNPIALNRGAPHYKGPPSAAQYVRQEARAEQQQIKETALAIRASEADGSQGENILIPINAFNLVQFVTGLVMRTTADTDSPTDFNSALGMIGFFISTLSSNYLWENGSWPRAIVSLGFKLRERRIGRFTFTPNWAPVTNWFADWQSNAFSDLNSGFTLQALAGTYTNGFPNLLATPISVPSLDAARNWCSQYAIELDLCPASDVNDDQSDASAFAFDLAGARTLTDINTGPALSVCNVAGMTSSGGQLYCCQSATVGLETPIKTKWLAELRLGTVSPYYNQTPIAQTQLVNPVRYPRYYWGFSSFPSTVGAAQASHLKIKKSIQLKPVPGLAFYNALIAQLEATVLSMPLSFIAGWKADFSLADIQMLVYIWGKSLYKRYSGCEFGPQVVSAAGTSNYRCDIYSCHQGFNTMLTARIPEFMMKTISSILPYADKYGTLWPITSPQQPSAFTNTSGFTYTGAGLITFPAFNPVGQNVGVYTGVAALCAKYRKYEQSLAQAQNMVLQSARYPSLLGVTLYKGSVSGNFIMVRSRTPITDDILTGVLNNSNVVGYDVAGEDTTYNFPSSQGTSTMSSKEYNLMFTRELSGFDTPALLELANKYNGIVTGALTSNISDATGTGHSSESYNISPLTAEAQRIGIGKAYDNNIASQLSRELPASNAHPIFKLASRMIPRNGNYCGPGWTAGVDTFNQEALLDGDKYVVAPTSKEDAICKLHDEEYRKAGEDRVRIREADERMVDRLDKLRDQDGLSWYGHASRLAIKLKSKV